MSTVIFKGEEAIHYAEEHGLSLNEYADGQHGPRSGLSTDEARRVEEAQSGHVWLEAGVAVNTGRRALPTLKAPKILSAWGSL